MYPTVTGSDSADQPRGTFCRMELLMLAAVVLVVDVAATKVRLVSRTISIGVIIPLLKARLRAPGCLIYYAGYHQLSGSHIPADRADGMDT